MKKRKNLLKDITVEELIKLVNKGYIKLWELVMMNPPQSDLSGFDNEHHKSTPKGEKK